MQSDTAKHVVFTGAGIIGICTALDLTRRGFQVKVVEASEPGGRQAASDGNGAVLSTAGTVPLSVSEMWKTFQATILPEMHHLSYAGVALDISFPG